MLSGEATRDAVDSQCRQRTAPWIRERHAEANVQDIEDLSLCPFYEALDQEEQQSIVAIPSGRSLNTQSLIDEFLCYRCLHVE